MPEQLATFLKKIATPLFLVLLFVSLVYVQMAMADTTGTTLNQTINAGTLSIDIVDVTGNVVVSPSVTFGAIGFSFDAQNSTGTLGVSAEKIRVSNPTTTATWNVAMAATGGPGTLWTTGTYTYPFDSTGGEDTGRLTVDPTTGTITPIGSGCTNTNVSLKSSAYFLNATTDSIDLFAAAAGADIACRWDLTGVSLTQRVPAAQTPGSYSLAMTLTVL